MRPLNQLRPRKTKISCDHYRRKRCTLGVQPSFLITKDIVRELFDYSPNRGALIWKGGPNEGQEAGYLHKMGGYKKVKIKHENNTREFGVHVAVWAYFNGSQTPGLVIDHKDRDPLNNRIDNLHEVTRAQNALNVWFDNTNSITGFMNITMAKKLYLANYRRTAKRFENLDDAIVYLADLYRNCPDMQLMLSRNVYLNYYADTIEAADKILSENQSYKAAS